MMVKSLKKINEKNYKFIYMLCVCLSFVPLIIISFYAHPSADDYGYAVGTFNRWNETHNLIEVLKAAFAETAYSWNTW